MGIRTELKVWMGIFLAIYLVITFGVVQLLARMAPAIEHILQENVYSVTAIEDMLAAAADLGNDERQAHFQSALQKAQSNITEHEEEEILKEIESHWLPAFAGDTHAMAILVQLLNRLGQVNRASMQRADDRAKRLGLAGAWAAVILGFSGFLLSLFAMRRLARRFVKPTEEIYDVLHAFRQGERYRRCGGHNRFPEFREIGDVVNMLMDAQWSAAKESDRLNANLNRTALLHLMDSSENPMALLEADGRLNAANQMMTKRLDGPRADDVHTAFQQAVSIPADDLPQGVLAEPLASGGWIVTLS